MAFSISSTAFLKLSWVKYILKLKYCCNKEFDLDWVIYNWSNVAKFNEIIILIQRLIFIFNEIITYTFNELYIQRNDYSYFQQNNCLYIQRNN